MLLNYHIGRFVFSSLCVGDLMQLGLSGVRVAGFSLQHGQVGLLIFKYYNAAWSNKHKCYMIICPVCNVVVPWSLVAVLSSSLSSLLLSLSSKLYLLSHTGRII